MPGWQPPSTGAWARQPRQRRAGEGLQQRGAERRQLASTLRATVCTAAPQPLRRQQVGRPHLQQGTEHARVRARAPACLPAHRRICMHAHSSPCSPSCHHCRRGCHTRMPALTAQPPSPLMQDFTPVVKVDLNEALRLASIWCGGCARPCHCCLRTPTLSAHAKQRTTPPPHAPHARPCHARPHTANRPCHPPPPLQALGARHLHPGRARGGRHRHRATGGRHVLAALLPGAACRGGRAGG